MDKMTAQTNQTIQTAAGVVELKMPQTKLKKVDRRSAIDRRTSKPRHWQEEEDIALKIAVAELGQKKWKLIAERVPGRNHTQCFQRWNKVLCPGLKKGKWAKEEDYLLVKLAKEQLEAAKNSNNPKRLNWGLVCKQIPGRTAKQCRERWVNNLNPEINKGEWTPEEDNFILELNSKFPSKWALIAKQLKGRTENAVKIRYHTLARNLNDKKNGGKPRKSNKRSRAAVAAKESILPVKKSIKLDQVLPQSVSIMHSISPQKVVALKPETLKSVQVPVSPSFVQTLPFNSTDYTSQLAVSQMSHLIQPVQSMMQPTLQPFYTIPQNQQQQIVFIPQMQALQAGTPVMWN